MSEKKMVKIMQPSGSNKCSGDSLFEVVSICVEIEFKEKGHINRMNHKKGSDNMLGGTDTVEGRTDDAAGIARSLSAGIEPCHIHTLAVRAPYDPDR